MYKDSDTNWLFESKEQDLPIYGPCCGEVIQE